MKAKTGKAGAAAPERRRFDVVDRAAAAALAAVDGTAKAQLAVLAALSDVADASPDDGVVQNLVVQFREARRAAFVRFHERTLKDDAHVLDADALAAAYDEAIAFTVGVAGDGEEAAALRRQKAVAVAAVDRGPPVPFFARFLDGQRR